MVLYQVTDGDELDYWFPTKLLAIGFAKENLGTTDITVDRIVTVPVTRESLCKILEHSEFVKERTRVLVLTGKEPI